ncbi:MAG: MFS transporter [Ilumatobacteraceae bacterium]
MGDTPDPTSDVTSRAGDAPPDRRGSPAAGHHGLLADSVRPRSDRTLSLDAAGVDELGVVPWPILLRRRLAARIGIERQWAVLWVVLGGLFTVSFTITILVVSLQRIADEFDASVGLLNWAITGPMLAFGVVGPAFGKAGDLWGHKRVFVTGLLVAGAFAALTALAWNAASMITFRILSASAGSACGPSAMAYINRLFDAETRVKPLGYWSFVTAGAPVLGVVAGGPLVESVGWRAIFAIQAPLCLVGVVVALWLLPDTDRLEGVRFDVRGSLTLGLGATSILAGISQAPKWGWTSPLTLGCLAVGVVSLSGFVWIERRVSDPLVVLAWFRTRNIAFPVLSQTLTNFATWAGSSSPHRLQQGLGLSAAASGLVVIARPLTFSLIAPAAGLVTIRRGGTGDGCARRDRGGRVDGLLGAGRCRDRRLVRRRRIGPVRRRARHRVAGDDVADGQRRRRARTRVAGAMQQLMSQLGAVVGTVVLTTISAGGGDGRLAPFQHAFWVAAVVATAGAVAAPQVRSTPRRCTRLTCSVRR